jgi:hypothetical protein
MALPLNTPRPSFDHAPPRAETVREPRREIARLALLHDEARETGLLANLLGRTPYAAATIALAAIAVAAINAATMPLAGLSVWLLLALIGAGAMGRRYLRAIRHPFERGTLPEFAYDLNAIAIYAGFAWGAGAMLAAGPQTSPLALAAYAALVPALVAAILRTREISLGFLAPAATLCAFSAVLRPLPEGPLAAAFVLIACAAVGGAIFWTERLFGPKSPAFPLADIPAVQP